MSERRRFVEIFSDSDRLTCARCGGSFRRDEMAKDATRQTGRKGWCVECDRLKNRAYYWANRERVLAKAAAKRGPVAVRHCSECGVELEPPKRVVCSSRCREARFRRLHPESYAEREAAKVVRRREKRRQASQALRGDGGCGGQSEPPPKKPTGQDA